MRPRLRRVIVAPLPTVAKRTGAKVVGLDMDPENVAKARSLFQHERLAYECGKAPSMLPAGKFDAVILSNVLEHIDRRPEFLRAVQAACAPRRFLIRVPMFNRDWRPPLRQELGLFPFSDPTHFTEYTRDTFEQEIGEAGLAVKHLRVNWGEIWAEAAAG